MAENVEYAWVEENIPKEPCRMLNMGSRNDETVESFIKKGHTIIGIDLQDDIRDREIKNYEFRQGNLLDMVFTEKFDCIYSISVIEHIGLECYGQKTIYDGDIKSVKKLFDLLKPGGIMLITVPYGYFTPGIDWRVYDENRLKTLVGNYKHTTTFFLAMTEIFLIGWSAIHDLPPTEEVMAIVHDNNSMIQINHAENVCSVACVKIQKPMEE